MIERSDWNHYSYTYGEGKQATVEFDVQGAVCADPRYPHGVRLRGEVESAAVADALATVDALLVGRLRYAQQTELVLQVSDAGLFGLASLPNTVTVERTNGWEYFDDRVCPTPQDWRRIEDREALARLDLDADHTLPVLHRFYGDPKNLDEIEVILAPERFERMLREGQSLHLLHTHLLGDISKITLGLLRLCDKKGVAYDGWILPG